MKLRKALFGLIILSAMLFVGCSEHEAVTCVKTGYSNARKDVTIGDACWYAFDSVKWKMTQQIDANNYYVVAYGDITDPDTYDSYPVSLKFKVNTSTSAWSVVEVKVAGESSTYKSDIRGVLDIIYALYDSY